MATDKQKLARRRNWLKFRLSGITIQYSEDIVTPEELQLLVEIESAIKILNIHFDKESKKLGFNIPEYRCWCGKEGKYPTTNEVYKSQGVTHTCKNHKDDN